MVEEEPTTPTKLAVEQTERQTDKREERIRIMETYFSNKNKNKHKRENKIK